MIIGIQRRKIEDRIVASYDAVNFSDKTCAWIDSDTFEDFIFSFFELRRYYEKSTDTAVGLETLRVYMDGLRALQAAAKNRTLSIDRRERSQRLMYELTYQVEAVMYEVDRNRQDMEADDSLSGSGGVPTLS